MFIIHVEIAIAVEIDIAVGRRRDMNPIKKTKEPFC
jgi:hypothetical protein